MTRSSTRAVAVGCILLSLLAIARPSIGLPSGDPTCNGELVVNPVTGRLVCSGTSGGGGDGPDDGDRGDSPTPTAYPYRELWYPILATSADGTCVDIATERIGRDPTPAEDLDAELQFMRWIRVYPICPDTPAPPTTSPPLEAASFLRVIDLPVPSPTIAPGRLPVGLDAYLETDAPTQQTYGPHPTPFGNLTLTATAEVFVDWDDPHDDTAGETGPYTVQTTEGTRPARPGPHPDGEITHLYQHDGIHRVSVRYEWTATWSIGTEYSGTIDGAETTGTYPAPGFEAYSRQAVG